MTRLRIFTVSCPDAPPATYTEEGAITHELAQVGVRFERWETRQPVLPGASQDEVIAAYREDIDRLMREQAYTSVDVVSLKPDHPERAALRQKFLAEHTHSEDEVRFFVAGAGQFTLHIADKVYDVLCKSGDFIGIPDGTPHWFDMSQSPYFVAIRLFTNKDGWIAHYTGSNIAQQFPRMRPVV